MAFLYCNNPNCKWEQDDFWNGDYDPLTFLEKKYTQELKNGDLDKVIKEDSFFIKEYNIFIKEGKEVPTRRELIAWELERHAKLIRNMVFRTEKEYNENNPEHKCPKCGERLCVD